ncbi:hypothetical protein D3C71_1495280 [compost metagenome]
MILPRFPALRARLLCGHCDVVSLGCFPLLLSSDGGFFGHQLGPECFGFRECDQGARDFRELLFQLLAAACPLAGDGVPVSLQLQLVAIEGLVLIAVKEEILALGLSKLLNLLGEVQLDGAARAPDLNGVRCVSPASDDLAASGDQSTDERFVETQNPVDVGQGRGDAQAAAVGGVPARDHPVVARYAAEEGLA